MRPSAGVPAVRDDYAVACMHELFAQQAAATARRPRRLTFEGATLSYGELNARANRLAHLLRARGVGRETLVALFLEPSVEMLVAILGVLKAGGAYVPLDPEYPADRIALRARGRRSAASWSRVAALADRLPAGTAVRRVPRRAEVARSLQRRHDSDPEPLATPDSLAYVIYTSGSTGRPKGVLVEHRNVARLFTATDDWYSFGPEDVWVLLHSYAFDFSVWELWGALAHGGRLVISPLWTTRSPADLAAARRRARASPC